jgi:hypothetical protein
LHQGQFSNSKTLCGWQAKWYEWKPCLVTKFGINLLSYRVVTFDVVINMRSGIGQWYGAGLRAGWSGVRDPAGAGNFSLHHRLQTASGAHPIFCPVGIRATFLGLKRSGRKADLSPPPSVEIKNAWSYTSITPVRIHGVVLS